MPGLEHIVTRRPRPGASAAVSGRAVPIALLCMLVALAARSDAAFTLLHSHNDVQAYPAAAVIADGLGNLYGTTVAGGFSNAGTVFKVKTDGTGFTLLHAFAAGPSDGENPRAPLILDGSGNLYGTTDDGGSSEVGTASRRETGGTGVAALA